MVPRFQALCARILRYCLCLFAASAFLVPGSQSMAQSAATPAKPAASQSPGAQAPDTSKEALVIEKIATRVREEADGTGSRETIARMRIQSDAGVKQMAVLTFTYTASNQQVDIAYVRVIKPDGSVVVTPDYNVQDMPADVSREAPMYSDIHEKHVAVRGLGVGDVLEYDLILRTLKPEVPGQFWMEYTFEKDLIVLDERLELDVPADKPVTVASADVQPTVTTASGRKVYRWTSSNLARPDPEKPKSTRHWKPSVQVTTFKSWEEVGAWYGSLQKDRLAVTPAIQAKADALTKGLTSEDEKVNALFAAVALHIHYVGLSFGIGRYQPHAAEDVLSNEYGDCKDKHTLLATLLKAEGIEAWPVLIPSSRELDEAVPSPAQFDHVITVVPREGKLIWMDSTAEVAPVGALFASLRDKQALVIPREKPAYLAKTPAALPFPQTTRFEADGKLSDKGEFTAHISQSYRGDGELLMRIAFREVPQSQWKLLLQNFSRSIGFGGEINNPVVSPVDQSSQPFEIAYDYTREKYGEWDDHRINPALPAVGWELMPGVKVIRPADDIDMGSPGVLDYLSTIQLPQGFDIEPPPGIHLSEDWAEYTSSYSFNNGLYSAERRLVLKKRYIPVADWEKYNRFRNAIFADESRMTPMMYPGAFPGLSPEQYQTMVVRARNMQELSGQLQPVRDALSRVDGGAPPSPDELATSLEACKQAVQQIEEKSLRLPSDQDDSLYSAQMLAVAWTSLGWMELEAKHLPEAETYLQAAWKLSQDAFAGYQYARVLEAEGKKAEAEHVYRLAFIGGHGVIVSNLVPGIDPQQRIRDAYLQLTGKPISATALNGNQYEGSLRAELDKAIEMRPFLPKTRINGQGYYAVAYEQGKAPKAVLLHGDKNMSSFIPSVEKIRFPVPLPSGSKARLLREVKLICTPYGGCDAYMMLPNKIEMPPVFVKAAPNKTAGAAGEKTIQIQLTQ